MNLVSELRKSIKSRDASLWSNQVADGGCAQMQQGGYLFSRLSRGGFQDEAGPRCTIRCSVVVLRTQVSKGACSSAVKSIRVATLAMAGEYNITLYLESKY